MRASDEVEKSDGSEPTGLPCVSREGGHHAKKRILVTLRLLRETSAEDDEGRWSNYKEPGKGVTLTQEKKRLQEINILFPGKPQHASHPHQL